MDIQFVGNIIYRVNGFPKHTRNVHNIVHGGALASYIDIATGCTLYAFDKKERAHVSAKLDIEFLNAGECNTDDKRSPAILIDT